VVPNVLPLLHHFQTPLSYNCDKNDSSHKGLKGGEKSKTGAHTGFLEGGFHYGT